MEISKREFEKNCIECLDAFFESMLIKKLLISLKEIIGSKEKNNDNNEKLSFQSKELLEFQLVLQARDLMFQEKKKEEELADVAYNNKKWGDLALVSNKIAQMEVVISNFCELWLIDHPKEIAEPVTIDILHLISRFHC